MDAQKIIITARSWVGTRFHHQGRKKGIGVDCIGLIVGVAKELRYKVIDQADYQREPKDGELQAALEKYLIKSELKPGCIALFKLEKEPQHVGIISDYGKGELGLIHAYLQVRKVVEHNLDITWRKRIVGTYEFPPRVLE